MLKHILHLGHQLELIPGSWEVIKTDKPGGDGFPDAMKRKRVVAFVELGVWFRRAIDDRLVVTKHVASSSDLYNGPFLSVASTLQPL